MDLLAIFIIVIGLAFVIIAKSRKTVPSTKEKRHISKKKLLIISGIVLSVALIATVSTIAIVRYFSMRGSCGNNLTWVYDGEGTLTISGTGKMYDYHYGYGSECFAPWKKHSGAIDTVIIEDGVKNIGNVAFEGCSSLTEVYIANSVTTIGDNAFFNCDKLTEITIPETVSHIGGGAFSYCSSLKHVDLPDNLQTIGSYAFYSCKSLNKIVLPQSIVSIGNSAFSYCINLTDITLPQGLQTIESYAFRECKNLSNIEIPESVTLIKSYAFSGCTSLSNIEIPESVTLIKEYAFWGCTSLSEIRFYCEFPFDDNPDMDEHGNKSICVFADVNATAYIDSSVVDSWYGQSTYYLLGELDWVY